VSRSFQIYDDNSDKQLSKAEFLKGVKDYQAGMNQAEVEKLFGFFDRDNSGTIDFDEFLRGLRVSIKVFMRLCNLFK
jgi:Ca2+-binding EF-hand superfamily protein